MPAPSSGTKHLMYVGTYTGRTSAGIHAYRFDSASGTAEDLGLAAEMREPSFLALHPSGQHLYAVSETDDFDEDGSGSVVAFKIGEGSGALVQLNEVSSRGGWPCHLNIDESGRMLIVANYKGGSIASFPIHEDGSVGEAASFFKHQGGSVHARQRQPHAHSADFSADNRFAFFSDLGLDQVKVYRVDPDAATVAPHDPPGVSVAAGSGPRHLALHPSGRSAYGLNELASTVTTYDYDAAAGTLSVAQTASTLPAAFTGENYTAEICVHPSGKFAYASNRGHDSVAIFAVDPATGRLTPQGRAATKGQWPRSFAISPDGRYLLVTNQNSGNIVVFAIHGGTGALVPTGANFAIDTPVCLVFAQTA
ncbi:MAG: lactonase family protein [Bryobacterales bacterium]|nr:lactonase family protein [Bryobacterales bacterium]